MKQRLTTEEFISRAISIHGDKYDYSKVNYINAFTKVEIICKKHGIFLQRPCEHLSGRGCRKCKYEQQSQAQRGTLEKFLIKAKLIHGERYDYSSFCYPKTNKYKSIIICKKHGPFTQSPHDHLNGRGCPKCIARGQYNLYCKLKKLFPDINILYEVGKNIISWIENQRFDIYFPDYNIAVEYDGEQHYAPVELFGGVIEFVNTIKRDREKEKKCKLNKCVLIRIKYNYSEKDYNLLINKISNVIKNKNYEI